MFSGIVKEVGKINKIEPKSQGLVISIESDLDVDNIILGSSICIDGVCLTVCEKKDETLSFEVMPETLRKTILGEKKVGDEVNMEKSLKVGDELGGHFIQGHIDGVGIVTNIEIEGDDKLVTIELSEELMKYLAPQGSISVNGVSLTVARVGKNNFIVSLIKFTLDNTVFEKIKIGDKVNIECDMFAKYIGSQLKNFVFNK